MQPVSRNNRGGILIATLLLMLFLGSLAGTLLMVQLHRDRLKNEYSNKISALYNAEGAVNYSVELLWNAYLAAGSGKPGKLGGFQAFLNNNAVVQLTPRHWVRMPLDRLKVSPGATATAEVYRIDYEDRTDLRFRSSVTVNGYTETVESTFRTEGHTFSGFNFALFSNNISCTFCHAKIDSVERWTGKPYERVRVAALESLMIRSGSADSTLAGALYTTGKIMDKSGTVLTSLASSSL